MMLHVPCDHCENTLKVSDSLLGKMVRCPKCEKSTKIVDEEDVDEPANGKQTRAKQDSDRTTRVNGAVERKRSAADDEDDDEDEPRKAKKTTLTRSRRDDDVDEDEDNEEDDRPARKRTALARRDDDEDEEEDDRPRSRKSSRRDRDEQDSYDEEPEHETEPAKSSAALLWLGIGGGLVLVVGIVAAFLILRPERPAQPQEVAVAPEKAAEEVKQEVETPRQLAPASSRRPEKTPIKETPKPVIPDTSLVENTPPKPAPTPPPVAPPPPSLPESIDEGAAARVKKATVFLKMIGGEGQQIDGWGFLCVEPGIVVTNTRVIGMLLPTAASPRKIEVVVNGGTATELKTTAVLMNADRETDLAILRILDTSQLPAPLPAELQRSSLAELQRVYIVGADASAITPSKKDGKDNKVPKLSESSVASLKKDADGLLEQIQVTRALGPNNSGGPVVDTRGMVVGVAVSSKGMATKYVAPSERLGHLMRGRVQDTTACDPYRDGQAIKLPLKVAFTDPFKRMREVAVEVWTGPADVARPASQKPPALQTGDAGKHTVVLTLKPGEASGDFVLPSMTVPTGHVYWIQPVLSHTAAAKHWAKATPFQPADAVLVDHVPADLTFLTTPPDRTMNLAAKIETICDCKDKTTIEVQKMTMQALETLEKTPQGAKIRLIPGQGEFTQEDDKGVSTPLNAEVQTVARKVAFSIPVDATGQLQPFTLPDLVTYNPLVKVEAAKLAYKFAASYQLTSLSVPNRQVNPQETWPVKLTLPGATPVSVDLQCTYSGTATVDGKTVAVLRLAGDVPLPASAKPGKAKNRITGLAHFDTTNGFFSKIKLTVRIETDQEGMAMTNILETIATRAAGNLYNITPPPVTTTPTPPPATNLPTVAGNIIFNQTNTLKKTDPPCPQKPGAFQQTHRVTLNAGKIYTIDLRAAPGSTLNPFLMVLDAGGNLMGQDDDSGGTPNAKIGPFPVPQTAAFNLVVTSSTPGDTGGYNLVVSEVGTIPQNVPIKPPPVIKPPPKR